MNYVNQYVIREDIANELDHYPRTVEYLEARVDFSIQTFEMNECRTVVVLGDFEGISDLNMVIRFENMKQRLAAIINLIKYRIGNFS